MLYKDERTLLYTGSSSYTVCVRPSSNALMVCIHVRLHACVYVLAQLSRNALMVPLSSCQEPSNELNQVCVTPPARDLPGQGPGGTHRKPDEPPESSSLCIQAVPTRLR